MIDSLKVNIKKEEQCKRIIDMEIPREEYAKEIEDTINELQKVANIPGFRQGKVPRNLVVQYYKGKIESDTMDRLIQNSYNTVLKKENLIPVSQATIKDIKLEDDKPVTFTLEVEIRPEIKLRKYKGIEIDEEKVTVVDKDVDDVLKHIQDRMAEYSTVENRQAKNNDIVTIDIIGFKDGVPLKNFKGNDLKLEIGASTVVKDIEDGIIGMDINSEKEINVKLPKDYYDKELQDKEITTKIKLKAIQEKKLPVLDDEFAKDVGECETLLALRKKIEEDIRKNREEEKKNAIKQKILKELISINTFEIPNSLVEKELDIIMDDIKERMKRENTSFETLKTTENEVREKYKNNALERVKSYLIIDEISKIENISASDDEVKDEITNVTSRMRKNDPKTLEYFSSDPVKERIRYDVGVRKTLDFLYDNAKIDWKSVIKS
jgi:trigger factor